MADELYFPLFVNLSGRKIVVVGAGRVAARRVRTLAAFAPRLTVVAPEIHPELLELERAGRVEVLRKPYERSDLAGAALALAATDDDAVNDAVSADCKSLGIPVNVSSDRAKCDFYFPGVARRGSVVVGVTASGRDHGEAKRVAQRARALLEEGEPAPPA